LKRLWQRIEAASQAFQHRIDQAGWQCFADSVGGYYKYLLLPAGVSDIELARAGAKESIFIAPGSVFCIDKQNPLGRGIRINVSRAQDMRFYDFLLRML
jgi:DNA-binding transcriptional MocR family regulator